MKVTKQVQTQIDKLMAAFQSGKIAGVVAQAMIERHPDDVRPSDKWSFRNRILMMLNGTADARGFKQWKQIGRSVMKGQRALHILAPVVITVDKDTPDERKVVAGFKGVAVFGVEQTDGEPMPTFDYEPTERAPLADVAESFGVEVTYTAGRRGAAGSYGLKTDAITMFSHSAPVFWHELAHAAHARVLKARGEKLVGGQDAKQEAVAELSAAVIAKLYGCDNDAGAYNYIKGYADQGDAHKLALSVLGDVEQVLELILNTETAAAEVAVAA